LYKMIGTSKGDKARKGDAGAATPAPSPLFAEILNCLKTIMIKFTRYVGITQAILAGLYHIIGYVHDLDASGDSGLLA